jgi:hypothetical protein
MFKVLICAGLLMLLIHQQLYAKNSTALAANQEIAVTVLLANTEETGLFAAALSKGLIAGAVPRDCCCCTKRTAVIDGVVPHCRKIPFMYSYSWNCAPSVPISTYMCLRAIYVFPGSFYIFPCSRIGRNIKISHR